MAAQRCGQTRLEPGQELQVRGIPDRRAAWIRANPEVEPTAARSRAAWSIVSQWASPRSTRPTSEPESPTAAPSARWLMPAIRRAPRTSVPSILVRCRPLRAPALITLSRTGMAGFSGVGLTRALSGDLTRGAGPNAKERPEWGSSSAISPAGRVDRDRAGTPSRYDPWGAGHRHAGPMPRRRRNSALEGSRPRNARTSASASREPFGSRISRR